MRSQTGVGLLAS